MPKGSFKAPEAGDAPAGVKAILKAAYESCRTKWTDTHPKDMENEGNKTTCSKMAWGAVKNAGWSQDKDGTWTKSTTNNQLHLNFKNEGYEVREETFNGRDYLVVPVVMIVEGVLNGSHGALLHTMEDAGKIPESWNGIPIVLNHPQDAEGNYISANSPEVLEVSGIGSVFETIVDGKKLKSEAWLDKKRLEFIAPEVLAQINEGNPVEISVGVFTEDEELDVEKDWKGVSYTAIARNHRPDHLAILPHDEGACSLEVGCGLGANKKIKPPEIINNLSGGLQQTLVELGNMIRVLNTQTPYVYNYLVEAYDDYVIYERNQTEKETKIFKQNYQKNVKTKEFELVDNPVEVVKQVTYINVTNNNKEVNMDVKKCEQCEEKIIAIINSNQTRFTKDDQPWLLTLTGEQLDKLMPQPAEVQANKGVTAEQIIQALNSMKPEDRVKLLPDEDQEIIAYGKKEKKARRDNLIKGIQDNTSKELWPDEVLNTMSEDNLKRLHNSVNKESEIVDYSALGSLGTNAKDSDEHMFPVGIEMEKN